MKTSLFLLAASMLLSQCCLVSDCMAQRTKPLQHFWEISPDFGDIWHPTADESMILFNVESLNSTQAQDRVHTAQWICRVHDNSNFKQQARGLELLISRLSTNEEPLPSKRALISAATLLDDGKNAAKLWEFARSDALMQSTVEKALIRWKSPVATEAWRKRLVDPQATPTEIARALDGLTAVGGIEDTAQLQSHLLANNTTEANRYLAAKAIGQLNRQGLNELAQHVLDSNIAHRHLLAASLLSNHTGERTLAQLRFIVEHGSDVALHVASQALVTHYPQVAREYAPRMAEHADSTMRMLALDLLDRFSDEASLRLQAGLLRDRNVEIRRSAGRQLVAKANEGQRAIVDQLITEQMNAEPWQGIEQATLMAVDLQDSSRCAKLVQLLEHPRPEVNMHAGWALMELAHDLETLASIKPHIEKATTFLSENGVRPPLHLTDTIRLSFLFEAIGKNRYEPMEELLMKYIPKNGFKLGYPSRASAIWALGQLNKGKDNQGLRDALCARIADLSEIDPEDQLIRFACILALGEMAFADSRPTIVKFNSGIPSPIGYACAWAIEQIDKRNPPN